MATARGDSANEEHFDHTHPTPRMNGLDKIPKPFVIGVAGGTASGKVR